MKNLLIGLGLGIVVMQSAFSLDSIKCVNSKENVMVELVYKQSREYTDFTQLSFSPKAKLIITNKKNEKITYGNVLISHDGAGNYNIMAIETESLNGFVVVANFNFEHEGAYLQGKISLPSVDVLGNIEFKEIELDESMKCLE